MNNPDPLDDASACRPELRTLLEAEHVEGQGLKVRITGKVSQDPADRPPTQRWQGGGAPNGSEMINWFHNIPLPPSGV